MSGYDFSEHAGKSSSFDLIPAGTRLWLWTEFRGLRASKKGGEYLDFELTVDDGQPYARKKLWDMIGNPNHDGNSDAYKEMGARSIVRMLETGRGASPVNPAAYRTSPDYRELDRIRVAAVIGIEEGEGGYQDKNRILEYLTPNPLSKSGNKGYLALLAGQYEPAARGAGQPAAVAPTTGFGGATRPPAAAAAPRGFGAAAQAATAAPIPTDAELAEKAAQEAAPGTMGPQPATPAPVANGAWGAPPPSQAPQPAAGAWAPPPAASSPTAKPTWIKK